MKLIRFICKKFCPALWQRLVLWKSNKSDIKWYSERATLVQECPDNARISRVSNAGAVLNGFQVMHNGLLAVKDCYYGKSITCILTANMGCHKLKKRLYLLAAFKV